MALTGAQTMVSSLKVIHKIHLANIICTFSLCLHHFTITQSTYKETKYTIYRKTMCSQKLPRNLPKRMSCKTIRIMLHPIKITY